MSMSRTAGRALFLDDDPARAARFLAARPGATWVRTAAECLALLAPPAGWAEVHLDHDLGGARFVDLDRADTGMEVVRWLSDREREHLRGTLFVVHSLNANAACVMLFHLRAAGYRAASRPFALPAPAADPAGRPPGLWRRLLGRAGRPGGR
jgi:hypothetical protein